MKEFDFIRLSNTSTCVVVKGKAYKLAKTLDGNKHCFVSKTKVLEQGIYTGSPQNLKYVNIFNEESQKALEESLNS
jgi:regulation of enolase protein 1 (concanavalin A-like superfamily)